MALNHSPSIVSDGLIFYLDAANKQSFSGSGTAWNDLTGNNNTTLVNSPTYTASNGGYFSFNGTNQEVTTTLEYTNFHTTSFTLCGWFRTSVASGRKIIGFERNRTGTALLAYDRHIYIDNTSGKVVWGVWNGTNNIITSTASYNDNKWHNFAATQIMGTGIELFVDGVSQGILATTSTSSTNPYLRIAGYGISSWTGGSNGYFTGDISALSLYSRTLSTAEIQNNFNALKGRYNV